MWALAEAVTWYFENSIASFVCQSVHILIHASRIPWGSVAGGGKSCSGLMESLALEEIIVAPLKRLRRLHGKHRVE